MGLQKEQVTGGTFEKLDPGLKQFFNIVIDFLDERVRFDVLVAWMLNQQ